MALAGGSLLVQPCPADHGEVGSALPEGSPDQSPSRQALPAQTHSGEKLPDQTLPGQALPGQALPDQTLPSQALPCLSMRPVVVEFCLQAASTVAGYCRAAL